MDVLKQKQPELKEMLAEISENGAGLAIDFSQKLGVDYCVMVVHYITMRWYIINNSIIIIWKLLRDLRHFVLACLPIPGDMPKTRENVTTLVNECLNYHGVNENGIFYITDEGSNVTHLGGVDRHHRCIAHILTTISRHITQPYVNADVSDEIKFVDQTINNLHILIGDLR